MNVLDIETILVLLKNNLDIAADYGDFFIGCLIDIFLNFLR